MAIKKEKKIELVEELTSIAKDSPSIVFVGFKKFKVNNMTKLRQSLRKEGVSFTVVKKTLLKRALDTNKIEGEMPELPGEMAIAYSNDELAPGREVFNFSKDFKEELSIVGGVFGGNYLDKAKMLEIATIPGREVLLGQFVNLINSPIQRFATLLSKIAEGKQG